MFKQIKPELSFLTHLAWIENVSRITCSKHGLWGAEAEDFAAWVNIRMMDDNYAIFRNFRRESNLRTYLAAVIVRLFSVYVREHRSRWRQSDAPLHAGELPDASNQVVPAEPDVARILAQIPGAIGSHSFDHPGILGPDGRPFSSEGLSGSGIITDVINTNEELLGLLRKDPSLVYALPPRKFEEIIADIFTSRGYEVALTPASNDGGFDMYAAWKDGLGEFLYLVECKRYAPHRTVGVQLVRALHGVVEERRANAGILVTTSHFTKDAKDFQRQLRHRLSLRDYVHLQKWLAVTVPVTPE